MRLLKLNPQSRNARFSNPSRLLYLQNDLGFSFDIQDQAVRGKGFEGGLRSQTTWCCRHTEENIFLLTVKSIKAKGKIYDSESEII